MTIIGRRRPARHGTTLAVTVVTAAIVTACGSSAKQATSTAHNQASISAQATVTASASKTTERPRTHRHDDRDVTSTAATTAIPAVTGASAARPATTSASVQAPSPTRAKKPKQGGPDTTTKSSRPPTVTTIAKTPAAPAYTGPDPLHCLQVSGLTNARSGTEQDVWIGNFGSTAATDTSAIVFLSGPYANAQEAMQYASALDRIPELATAGGRWVASAAATSHLDFQVKSVAGCMAGSA